jgi:N-acylneuraminate cytidylyltransferase/CMP-N,N'-diacetyllegionaminic acid synthase
MYRGKKFLAIIPARGGSKGIPHKNIMDLCGKPLISYSIEEAKKSKYIDYVLVSTDDEEIKEVSMNYGANVPFLRPDKFSDDKAKSIDVVIHAIEFLKNDGNIFDYVVLLQPTSPLRTYEDIDSAIELILEKNESSLVSVCEVDENPILMRIIENDTLKSILEFNGGNLRRQDLPTYYIFSGALYINTVEMILCENTFINEKSIPFIMERSKSIDIDNILDAKLAKYILEEKGND